MLPGRSADALDYHIDGADLADVVRDAAAPVVVETPGGVEGQSADIAWLRGRLAG